MSAQTTSGASVTVQKASGDQKKPLVMRVKHDENEVEETVGSPVTEEDPKSSGPRVTWDESVVDPPANQRTSKCCCVFTKPRAFGESDSESDPEDSSDSDSDREYGQGECHCKTALR